MASYNKNSSPSSNDPDGLVLVWNLLLPERPEFHFHAPSDVHSAAFSPFHSHLIVGGSYSGQLLVWDTRSKSHPVMKTPLSTGHTHPIYCLKFIGTQSSHSVVSISTDGLLCSWQLDMLGHPQVNDGFI